MNHADSVAAAVVRAYRELPARGGKPQTRSNSRDVGC